MQTMTRISIPITIDEREALRMAAEQKMLDPRVHARYILRRALFGKSPPNSALAQKNSAGQVSQTTGAIAQ